MELKKPLHVLVIIEGTKIYGTTIRKRLSSDMKELAATKTLLLNYIDTEKVGTGNRTGRLQLIDIENMRNELQVKKAPRIWGKMFIYYSHFQPCSIAQQ